MAIDAIQMFTQMRLVTEINEIRHQRNWHPLDALVGVTKLPPFLQ